MRKRKPTHAQGNVRSAARDTTTPAGHSGPVEDPQLYGSYSLAGFAFLMGLGELSFNRLWPQPLNWVAVAIHWAIALVDCLVCWKIQHNSDEARRIWIHRAGKWQSIALGLIALGGVFVVGALILKGG